MSSERKATITPGGDTPRCEEDGCTATELLARVDPDGIHPARTLCPEHRVAYLREVYAE